MNTAFLRPTRKKTFTVVAFGSILLGGVAVKLMADERSQQRDRAFVTNELSRVQEMVVRSGASVASAQREISELHETFESFRGRIDTAAAEIGQRQTELVALISRQETMAEQLAALQRELSSSFAEADGRLAVSSERIDRSKMGAKQRQSLIGQVALMRSSVTERKAQAAQIDAAARRNAELLADAQSALATVAEQQQFAETAKARAAELENRSAERQSRANELSRKLRAAQQEIDSLTSGASKP